MLLQVDLPEGGNLAAGAHESVGGVDIDVLERACKQSKPKLFSLHIQNARNRI